MKNTLPLYLIAVGIIIIVLQNAGIIQPLHENTVTVRKIEQTVDVSGRVDVSGDVDANISSVAGRYLVSSKAGMYIGVSSTENTVIPIHWGEISISR
jgi:hypothetical protein